MPLALMMCCMLTLAVANFKGGTGKTTTTRNLGQALAADGRRVLLIDADPSGALTAMCQVDGSQGGNLSDVIGDAQPGELQLGDILRELGPCLSLAPSDLALTVSELGLVSRAGRENVLRRALASVAGRFDLALIDSPPALGLLTLAVLVAADGVLIPTKPGGADLAALRAFLGTVARAQQLNPGLAVFGILPTFVDLRTRHHNTALAAMRAAGLPVLPMVIKRSVIVEEAAAAGQPLAEYDPGNAQLATYKALAELVETWLDNNPS